MKLRGFEPPHTFLGEEDLPKELLMSTVVLTDLRIEPLLMILHLTMALPSPRLLISEASLRRGDFGDPLGPVSRWVRVAIVRLLSTVVLVPLPKTPLSHDGCLGCMSSLVSLTLDEDAIPAENPAEWERLNRLCEGAHAVARQLETGVHEVYIFNGRLASVRPISMLNRAQGHPKVYVYEWGPLGGTFRLERYPLWNPAKISSELTDYAAARDFTFCEEEAEQFRRRKLKNPFSTGRDEHPPLDYKTVIFAGSQHEYRWTLDSRDYLDADFPQLLRAAVSHPDFSAPAALKLHPNSSTSRHSERNESRIRELCREFGVDLIESTSLIDRLELIRRAKTVMVGASSVSLDAFLLGHRPVFLGPNPYKGLIEAVIAQFGVGEDARLRAAGLAAAYAESKILSLGPGLRQFGEIWRRWVKFRRQKLKMGGQSLRK